MLNKLSVEILTISEHNTDNGNDGSRSSCSHSRGCVTVTPVNHWKKPEISTHSGIFHKFTVRQDQVARLRGEISCYRDLPCHY